MGSLKIEVCFRPESSSLAVEEFRGGECLIS
jgi:hypothetical protein